MINWIIHSSKTFNININIVNKKITAFWALSHLWHPNFLIYVNNLLKMTVNKLLLFIPRRYMRFTNTID